MEGAAMLEPVEVIEPIPDQASARQKKRNRTIFIFCAISAFNIALFALFWTQLLTPASHPAPAPLVGQPAPNFSLTLLHPSSAPSGKSTFSLADLKGRPAVLNFWASWCDPCKQETPLLESAWKQAQAQGKAIIFLGIDYQETSEKASSFLQAYSVTYPAVLDGDGSVGSKYFIAGLPQTIFINSNGIVVSRTSGQLTTQSLASGIQSIT